MLIASLTINGHRCHVEEMLLLLDDFGIHGLALNGTKLGPQYLKERTMIMGY